MARDPKSARQRTPTKADVVKSSPAHKLGTRFEGGDRGVARNTPTLGNRGAKRRAAKGKGKSGKR